MEIRYQMNRIKAEQFWALIATVTCHKTGIRSHNLIRSKLRRVGHSLSFGWGTLIDVIQNQCNRLLYLMIQFQRRVFCILPVRNMTEHKERAFLSLLGLQPTKAVEVNRDELRWDPDWDIGEARSSSWSSLQAKCLRPLSFHFISSFSFH